ncbi:structural protein [Nocardiopsis protaetiae]|uniref:hypothetical protein n=1 Tax=Nocardiopsis protaetiae TaxID=3382270 RepID=UPI00387B17AC
MTVTDLPAPPTPAQQLDQAERQAAEELAAIIAAAVAAGITGAALLAIIAALIGATRRAAQTGWAVGTQLAHRASAGQRVGRSAYFAEPLPTSVDADVVAVVVDAAQRIDAARTGQPAGGVPVTPATPEVELARFQRRMVRLAITKIHQAASAATYSYARWLGMDLEWVTRRDGKACAVCAGLNGVRVGPGQKFTPPRGRGVPRRLWAGFQGLPPSHPNCRCRCIPREPRPRT